MYLKTVEQRLLPAFELIKFSGQIDFDEYISKTMNILINSTTQVSDVMWQILPFIIQSLSSHNMIYKEFFHLVRAYINYGKDNPQISHYV